MVTAGDTRADRVPWLELKIPPVLNFPVTVREAEQVVFVRRSEEHQSKLHRSNATKQTAWTKLEALLQPELGDNCIQGADSLRCNLHGQRVATTSIFDLSSVLATDPLIC